MLLPLVLVFVLLAVFRPAYLLLSLAFFTPLSIPLRELVPGLAFDLNLPTEPLLVGIMVLFGLQLLRGEGPSGRLLRHPVSLALAFYLFWMLLCSVTSTMPLVSFKFWLSKVWFMVGFYLLGFALFAQAENFRRFVLLYCLGFVPVIAYAWWRQSAYGFFDQQAANFVMNPFYKDHTSYGAMLAFFLPALLLLGFNPKGRPGMRLLWLLLALLFSVALLFSYTRAAWLSLVASALVFIFLKLKIPFRALLFTAFAALALLLVFRGPVLERLFQNKQESSSEMGGHLESMSNISTDQSNVERLNRWSCAWDMFREKPLFGWGPGTYMFQYAPFQWSKLRTRISTNSADGGNAHSEYLGALSETGLIGMLSFMLLAFLLLKTGIQCYSGLKDEADKRLALAIVLGLVSYLSHSFLNNFLDTDKAAVPFWAFAAFLVLLDLKNKAYPPSKSN